MLNAAPEVAVSNVDKVVEELRGYLPPVFAGSSLGKLTGDAIHWPTIQNARMRHEIPGDCFVLSGRKILVVRDEFLNWWKGTLKPSRS